MVTMDMFRGKEGCAQPAGVAPWAAMIVSPFPQPLQMGPSPPRSAGQWLFAVGFVWPCQDLEHDPWHLEALLGLM